MLWLIYNILQYFITWKSLCAKYTRANKNYKKHSESFLNAKLFSLHSIAYPCLLYPIVCLYNLNTRKITFDSPQKNLFDYPRFIYYTMFTKYFWSMQSYLPSCSLLQLLKLFKKNLESFHLILFSIPFFPFLQTTNSTKV